MSARSRLTRPERAVVAALADTMAAPVPPLPAVTRTDTVDAFADWVGASPPPNRAGLRAGLIVLALAPLAFGHSRGLPRLDRAARTAVLRRCEQGPLRSLVRALSGAILMCYYGDDGVARLLGYDAASNVERGRGLIASEQRVA